MKRRLFKSNGAEKKDTFAPAEKPIQPMEPLMLQFCVARNQVSIEKAQRILGYQPRFDFVAGMAETERWARWANLLGWCGFGVGACGALERIFNQGG